ncbi:MAG TPA: hypothetical protein VHI12_09205 [Gaiellaceae bacterium]|nr:hypothetical protein [Gaiellaceae bacterium]
MERSAAGRRVTRDTWIGLASLLFASAAMALDHLVGNESESPDTGLVDPVAFAVSVALSSGVAVLLFGSVVPRAENRGPERAAVIGAILSVLSFVPGIGFLWLGFPFVIAGAGIALALVGLSGTRRRLAIVALAIAALPILVGTAFYVTGLVNKLS